MSYYKESRCTSCQFQFDLKEKKNLKNEIIISSNEVF